MGVSANVVKPCILGNYFREYSPIKNHSCAKTGAPRGCRSWLGWLGRRSLRTAPHPSRAARGRGDPHHPRRHRPSRTPSPAVFSGQGLDRAVASRTPRLLAVTATATAGACRHHVEVLRHVPLSRSVDRRLRPRVDRASQPRRRRRRHQPVRPWLVDAYRHVEDRRAQAGDRPVRLRPLLRRGATRRGTLACQRTHLLDSFGPPPLGSQAPTPRTLADLQRKPSQR